ncbi:MAG: cyclic nucleotide-binding domain-containing protein [Betaproteobacteria bacterium]|jgi:CRP/FNR family cyclic AMP-dependent transcriptional regulator|nr:MAG: cyclic nucleotide-binding domain-containing protein [Betaproteobacteria bacterium]
MNVTPVVSPLLLRSVPLFSLLPDAQLLLLTPVLLRKPYPKDSTIIAAGDSTDALYIVISGRLKVIMSDNEGREVILAILNPGEFFGEMGLIDQAPRSATVVTLESCELLTITRTDFTKCLQKNFDFTMNVMRGLVKRLREADTKIGSLALMDVCGRVARLLMEMAETIDGQKVITKRLPKQQIAKMIGASREMVSRVMKDLETNGHIEVRARQIVLRDSLALTK